jgi:hypothetical protein
VVDAVDAAHRRTAIEDEPVAPEDIPIVDEEYLLASRNRALSGQPAQFTDRQK